MNDIGNENLVETTVETSAEAESVVQNQTVDEGTQTEDIQSVDLEENSPQTDYAPPNYTPQDAPKTNGGYTADVVEGEKGMSTMMIGAVLIVLILAIILFCAYFIFKGENNSVDTIGNIFTTNETQQTELSTPPAVTQQIILDIKEKPSIDEVYYEDDGVRFTPQGVAKFVGPSIVSVVVYEKGNNISPIGQGSGIIISSDGYIITNAHVIEGAYKLKVILDDERELEVKIVGKDTKTDIGVLKASGVTDLVAADLGDANQLELGEPVVAIGSPDGLSGSITLGVISGLNRQIEVEGQVMRNCIQTDAAINPGNSGGALVNMFGQVIGITSSKYADVYYEGMGFAIPITEARPIIDDIITKGYVSGRIRIGIVFQGISEASARINEIEAGICIVEIAEDCDIFNSGLEIGDIITEVDGKKVYDYESLIEAIGDKKPNDICTAKVYRKSIVSGEDTWFDIEFKLMEDTTSTSVAE